MVFREGLKLGKRRLYKKRKFRDRQKMIVFLGKLDVKGLGDGVWKNQVIVFKERLGMMSNGV